MSRFLLDTCVVTEPLKKVPDVSVVNWWRAQSELSFYISALTVGEIEKGIAKLPQSSRRTGLVQSLQTIIKRFDTRVLSVDVQVAETWGRMVAESEKRGHPIPAVDGLIGATALTFDLVVVTRNIADFEPCGVRTLNPFS